jgi:hypothetical protein
MATCESKVNEWQLNFRDNLQCYPEKGILSISVLISALDFWDHAWHFHVRELSRQVSQRQSSTLVLSFTLLVLSIVVCEIGGFKWFFIVHQ